MNGNELFDIAYDRTYEYELLVVPGLVLNHSMSPTVKKVIKRPPMWIYPDELGGSDAAGKTFTIGVRLKTAEVSQYYNQTTISIILNPKIVQ